MMAFWNRLFRRKESSLSATQPHGSCGDPFKEWVHSINGSLLRIEEKLEGMPSETIATINESAENRNQEVLRKLDELPGKITGPLKENMAISKQEILSELVRISSRYSAHDSHDSDSAQRQAERTIHEITMGLTGKQKRLLAVLMDSGFLSYAEIGEKLGITHESAKNLVNRLLKDTHKGRLFSKQETDEGIKVGVSSDVQDEVLKKKYRTVPNDSQ
jgi:DNA-binding CsgD family transcriptional regulator